MGSMTTRFFTARLSDFAPRVNKVLTVEAKKRYQDAADEVAEYWSNRIPEGRGGQHNAQMKNISAIVTTPKIGGFFVRVGWLNNPPMAENGATTWFVYHDTGYHFYGGPHWVKGLMIQQDARGMLIDKMKDASDQIASEVEAAARRL